VDDNVDGNVDVGVSVNVVDVCDHLVCRVVSLSV